jgi:hypothetical protein
MSTCPKTVKEGHCDDCLRLKAKKCEGCGSTEEVKFRCGEGVEGCFCYNCRMAIASHLSLTRSW